MPTIELLQQQHPEFDGERLLDLVALYRGGKCFSARVQRFVPQNDYEPEGRYLKRLGAARYFNYLGPIIDRFASALIQVPPSIAKSGDEPIGDYLKAWQADVDGLGTDLSELARETITDALMKRRTFVAVERPTGVAQNAKEWNELGLGNIRIRELETQCVIDWSSNEGTGELEWLIHHECEKPRVSPTEKRHLTVETWTIYNKQTVDKYQIAYEHGNRPGIETEVPLLSSETHGLERVPVVVFEVSEGMWLAERAHDAQVEHFTQRSALNWALKASCFAIPIFHIQDSNVPPVMGTGTGMMLGPEDSVTWFAPPDAPFQVMAASIESCREELYRIVHQMADGVSSSASNSAKSAKSKQADLIATKSILEAYAVILRDVLQRIVDLVCSMRGDKSDELSIAGLDKFSEVDILDLFTSIETANRIGMPSETFQLRQRELMLDTLMPQLSEEARSSILEELKGGLAELKKQNDLDAQYQQALAHAVAQDTAGKRPGNAPPHAGGGSGGPPVDAKKANPTSGTKPGGAQPPGRRIVSGGQKANA